MKATIRDQEVLRSLQPLEIAHYLRNRGWRQVERIEDKGLVWSSQDEEILLPLDHELADYVLRMADVLKTLEMVEQRSQLEIVNDLVQVSADVVRIRLTSTGSEDGAVSLNDGVTLAGQARDLLMAAACAAVEPRAIYPARKPAAAIEYLERVRLGHEKGSYVLALRCPVPPELGALDEPFERRVTKTLALSVQAARTAAQRAAATGQSSAFADAVNQGVSANLCEALAGLIPATQSGELTIDINWSPSRPAPDGVPRSLRMTRDSAPILKEASRTLRERLPRPDFELAGLVIKLERLETADRVTVTGLVDSEYRRVQVDLEGPARELAIEAYRAQQPLRCEGELVHEGRTYRLANPRNLIKILVDD